MERLLNIVRKSVKEEDIETSVIELRQYRIKATIRIIQQVPSKNCG